MVSVQTRFLPADHGFRFINRFELNFPVKFTLPLIGSIDLSQVVFGLCGGMCFAALDYYHNQAELPLESDVDQIDSKLFLYLCERQLDSLRVPVLVKVIEWMLIEDREIHKRMKRSELPKLRRQLDKGEPTVLALIRSRKGQAPTLNHQVLATGYSINEAAQHLTIQLYDPNHPCENPVLDLDLARNGNQALTGWIRQSSGEELRGFFIIPYKPQKSLPRMSTPAPGTLGLESLPERPMRMAAGVESGFSLRWPVDSGRVTQKFGEHPELYRGFGLPGHEGLDLLAPSGANIYASADGEVYQANHPNNHPYGLHVRIKHLYGGKTYHTIYGHMAQVFVSPGQKVRAGERIGLADNTGNSFGSHLHLTLKLDGAQTPGYPRGIIDPLPYLRGEIVDNPDDKPVEEPKNLPPSSGVTVYTLNELNLRSGPNTDAPILALLPSGEPLDALGNAEEVRAAVGKQGSWLPVRTKAGRGGYVAAWHVQTIEGPFPPSGLVVYSSDIINIRSGPGKGFEPVCLVPADTPLTVLGDEEIARGRLGKKGEWIQVQTKEGQRGFAAAWLVHVTGAAPKASGLCVLVDQAVNLRARPTTDANILGVVLPGEPLEVLGDRERALENIGQMDHWLNVRTRAKLVGYVAAWLVRLEGSAGPVDEPVSSTLTVFPSVDLNLRAQPSLNSPRVNGAFRNEPLQALEDNLEVVRGKIGKENNWIYVQKQDGKRGWAAAWFLSLAPV